MFKDRVAIKRDAERLEEWVNRNTMQFNKDECPAPHQGKRSPCNEVAWQWSCWAAALQKKPWASWQTTSCKCPVSKDGQQHPELHEQQYSQEITGRDYTLL